MGTDDDVDQRAALEDAPPLWYQRLEATVRLIVATARDMGSFVQGRRAARLKQPLTPEQLEEVERRAHQRMITWQVAEGGRPISLEEMLQVALGAEYGTAAGGPHTESSRTGGIPHGAKHATAAAGAAGAAAGGGAAATRPGPTARFHHRAGGIPRGASRTASVVSELTLGGEETSAVRHVERTHRGRRRDQPGLR